VIWLWVVLVVLLGGAAYWLVYTTEGTYLGSGIVTLLYDWTARRYDKIKDLHFVDEARYLAIPLVETLGAFSRARVLDVATGTGRLPIALGRQYDFAGTVTGIDRSYRMLAEAHKAIEELDGISLLRGDAHRLPFADESFDCVTCLEAVEFMSDPRRALCEMMRVLVPGGVMMVSNRVGAEASLFPARITGRGQLERVLAEMGMKDVSMRRWQVHYDLVFAIKPLPWLNIVAEAPAPTVEPMRKGN